ncbi:unnamed protein product, partial [marine sediment metagenome]
MSSIKTKGEKVDMPNSLRENINKNLGLIFIISVCVLIILFVTLQIKVNNLSIQTEKYIENVNLKNEEIINKVENLSRETEKYIESINLRNENIVSRVEDLSNEVKKYSQVKIGRDQFTEIYMQLQELTGMISNEIKREFYITKAVGIISKNNSTIDSKSIYEISKTIYEESVR